MANDLSDLGKKDDAINFYTIAIELNPKDADAYIGRGSNLQVLLLGIILSDLGKKDDAISDYTRAIELNPKYAQAYNNRGSNLQLLLLGIILSAQGKKDDALLEYQTALELVPNNPLYLVQVGNMYYTTEEKEKAKTYFNQAEQQLKLLTDEKMKEFYLSNGNVIYIKEKIKLIGEIEIEIEKTKKLCLSNTLSQQQQHDLKINLQEVEKQFDQEIIKPIKEDSDNTLLQQILIIVQKLEQEIAIKGEKIAQQEQQIGELKQGQIQQQQQLQVLQSEDSFVVRQELELLKSNKNQYLYYKSLYWRLQSYLLACIQISTDLLTTNNDAVIETTSEQVAQVVSKVGVAIVDNIPIPLISTAFNLLDSALEFYKKRKLQVRVKSLVDLIKNISGTSELEVEIKFGVIQLAKLLPDNLQLKEEQQNLYQFVYSIVEVDYNGGIKEANDPYWIQGIYDSISILHYLEDYNSTVQGNSQIQLRDMIVKGTKQNLHIILKAQPVPPGPCSNLCSVQ